MCIVCKLSGFNFHSGKNNIVEKVDAAANSGSVYSLSDGDSFSGILDNKNDEDWIKVDLEKGETYTFELKSLDDTELNNAFIDLYDADENLIKSSSYESEISFTAEYSGSFYLSTNSKNNEQTNYILSLKSQRDLPTRDFGDFAPASVDASNTWSEISGSNAYIQGLMVGDGIKWGDNPTTSDTELNYHIYEDEEVIEGLQTYAANSEETAAFGAAMDAFEAVSNITFTQVDSDENAHILWAVLNDTGSEGALGWAYTPGNGNLSGLTTQNYESYTDVVEVDGLDTAVLSDDDILLPGSYYFITAIHELGHAVGLSHPHDDDNLFPGVENSSDGGDNGLNAAPYTVMTYNDVDANDYVPDSFAYSGYLETLGAFDIAAVQYLYGANEDANTGDNTYYLEEGELDGWQCIWDNGGTDIISAYEAEDSVNIDLRNATLENEEGGGGYASQIGDQYKGYLIAYNSTGECIIENAEGSQYADEIRGNSANNTIYGDAGDDEIKGDGGDDKLYGDGGKDKLIGWTGDDYLKGGSSADKLYGGSGADYLRGGTSADRLYGDSGKDRLKGESGDDYLKGGSSADKLYGGSGNDTLIGGTGKDDVYGGSGKDIFKLTKGSGYDKIRDFKKKTDKIYIKGFKSLRIKDDGKNAKIYSSKDLLAVVYGEDDLSKSGNYLI